MPKKRYIRFNNNKFLIKISKNKHFILLLNKKKLNYN